MSLESFNNWYFENAEVEINNDYRKKLYLAYCKGEDTGFSKGVRAKEAIMLKARNNWRKAFENGVMIDVYKLLLKYENDFEGLQKELAAKIRSQEWE